MKTGQMRDPAGSVSKYTEIIESHVKSERSMQGGGSRRRSKHGFSTIFGILNFPGKQLYTSTVRVGSWLIFD
jgi:hypothetical protein